MNQLINNLLNFRNTVKIYHWNTIIYKDHIISNDLLDKLDELTDKLIETMLGSNNERINNMNIKIIEIKTTEEFIKELKENYDIMEDIEINKDEIKNIIDDIKNEILKSIYLLNKK
jgi:hypothetical protein